LVRGEDALLKVLRKGNILNPVLAEIPEQSGRFVHPILLPEEFSIAVYEKAVRDRILILKICAFYATLTTAGGAFFPDFLQAAVVMASMCLIVGGYCFVDYRTIFVRKERLAERCAYYGWLFLKCRSYLAAVIIIYLASGAWQFLAGGELFLDRWGLIYDLPDGEWWRVMTGSIIHSGPLHWLSNFAVAIGIAAACGPVLKKYFPVVFFLGGFASFLLCLAWNGLHPSDHDGLVGTSGGLAALLGAQLFLCFRFKHSYPRQYYLTILYFVMISMIVAAIFLSSVSLPCHIFGLLAGAALAYGVPDYLNSGGDESAA